MTRKSTRWQQAPALAVSLVALFAALTGAAVALPGKSTVNSGDIKDNTVKSVDLRDGAAVASADVIDETLLGVDVKDGEIASADVTDDSLTSTDVKNATLTGADVQDGSLASADVQDNSLTANDLAANSVTNSELADNAVTSGKIANGQVRSADLGPTVVRSNSTTVPPGASGLLIVQCSGAETVLSGGGVFDAPLQPNKGVQATFPSGNTWVVVGRNNTAANQTLRAHALCLSV